MSKVERRQGTYAAAKYDEVSCMILAQLMGIWKIPNPINTKDLHTTIIYSRTPIPEVAQHNMDSTELKSRGWKFSPKSLELFSSSSEKDDKSLLVMLLGAPELINLHNELVKTGATHDFPEYIPHVTLSYDVPANYDWQSIILPPIYFIPNKIYFEPLDIDWQSDN